MFMFSRAWVRGGWLAGVLSAALLPTTHADDLLTLGETVRLATHEQPLLEAQTAASDAARERAVAAGQLPDPRLKAFVQNLPANATGAWRFNRDFMTMTGVGLMQELPLPGKRRLRAENERIDARLDETLRAELARRAARDAGLAWVEVWSAQRAQALLAEQVQQGRDQAQAAAIAYRNGRGGQAEVLAVRVAAERLADRREAEAQKLAAARADLSRWIGAAAQRPLPDALPALPDPPPLDTLLAQLPQHPALLAAARAVERADNGVALARQNYWPDLDFELDYAYRQDYSEMVSASVGIGLPFFTRNRQDRELAAARREVDAAQDQRDDLLRQLAAQTRADYAQWQTAAARLARYDRSILPQAEARSAAALADYRAGNGTLSAVLEARIAALDAALERLQLAAEVARLRLSLRYFESQEPKP